MDEPTTDTPPPIDAALRASLSACLGAAERSGLGLGELRCLLAIAERPGISVTDLAKALGKPQATVSRHIKALSLSSFSFESARLSLHYRSGHGLVEQAIDPRDARTRLLRLTEAGRQWLSEALGGGDVNQEGGRP